MKRIKFVFLVFLVIFILFSCGINVPKKLPETIKVKYKNHVEIPLTALHYELNDFTTSMIESLENSGFKITSETPITVSTENTFEISPKIETPIEGISGDATFNVFDKTTILNFSIISDSSPLEMLSFDNVEFKIFFESTTTNLDSTLTFYLNDSKIILTKNSPEADLSATLKNAFENKKNLEASATIYVKGTPGDNDEFGIKYFVKIPLSGTVKTDYRIISQEVDLTSVATILENIESAYIVFKEWKNQTGLSKIGFKLGNISSFIDDSNTKISITKQDFADITKQKTLLEIFIPKDSSIQINSSSYIDASSYLSLDLNLENVEFTLGGE
ncbi:MAG: hypothetical protein PWQ45_1147 [Thermosipho sp. (in: thermotogales)]|nr:hypothetical protein [Thermosipho sp. (in: thermotogales)]